MLLYSLSQVGKLENFLQILEGFVGFQRHPNLIKTGNIFFNSEEARLHAEETYYENDVRIKPMWKNNNIYRKKWEKCYPRTGLQLTGLLKRSFLILFQYKEIK
jgi:hypothetical protein